MKLETQLLGLDFQNPVLLAAGTCGFGMELEEVLDLESLGGFVTKSITMEPRAGNPAPRVTEFDGGMLNSVGLANPGLVGARRDKLPWLEANVRRARVFVSVAGHTVDEFFQLIEGLDGSVGFVGFEVNLSCPNDANRGGPPFALDPESVSEIMAGCRARTDRPLLAKLAPNDPDIGATARRAIDAGADALTVSNTMPGLLMGDDGRTRLGAGAGGMSGPAVRPAALKAVREARSGTDAPIVGVGGVLAPEDAVAFARVGAGLVQMGTATFALPTAAPKLVRGLAAWGRRNGVSRWDDLVGSVPAGVR